MQVFKVKENGFKEIKKQTLIRTIPVLLTAVTAGIVVSYNNLKGIATDVSVFPILVPIIVVLLGSGIYRGLKRQKSLFDSYTLTITNDLITREQINTPTVSIYFKNVREIVKHKYGNYVIKGQTSADLIDIPAQIDNSSDLEVVLQRISPIIANDGDAFLKKRRSLIGLLTIGLMVCVYTISNKVIVALAGIPLIILLVWSFVKIRCSKNIDNKTGNSAWWMLLVLASVIAVMIIKFTGIMDVK